ncbi:type II CRISPR-associated endonuclease Cas1 [Mycoplasma sp. ATU-Cv-508]|uniref:type II CRISPR-associated endonuclease Cas1 n=1 Tax=Mycoplasma sp. ATU-Cv-508 TaxID=2048001 RepID=UPI000FDCEC6B
MGWKVVQVNTDDHLKLYLNNILIKRESKKIIININDIDVLLLDNYKLTLSVQLINAITQANGLIITFNSRREPASYVFSVNGNHMSLKVLENQIAWTSVYKGKLWQEVIRNKINNQYHLLTEYKLESIDDEFFLKTIEQVKPYDVTNREGHAAKVYWALLFGQDFTRDYYAKQNPTINSMLNYGYAVLRGLVIKSIVKKGLDPRISIYHKSFSNFYALASDLMEPFRPIIDRVVYQNRDAPFLAWKFVKN